VKLQNHITKLILSWTLGYMRWTQLTPMLLLWGFSLMMVLALTFVNFQEQAITVLEFMLEWLVQLPLVGEYIMKFLSDETSNTHIRSSDLKSFVLSSWALVSLVFMLVGIVLSFLFGPFKPWVLKRKILITGVGTVLLLAGMVANYYAAPQNFNGEASAWMLNFSLISLLVFVVSAYCLSISHFLGYLNDALISSELNAADNSKVIQ